MSAAEEILSRLPPEGSGGKTVRDLRMESGFTQEHIRNCLKRLERENKVAHGPLESHGFDTLRGGRSPDVWFLKSGFLLSPPREARSPATIGGRRRTGGSPSK